MKHCLFFATVAILASLSLGDYRGCPSYPDTVLISAAEFQHELQNELSTLDQYLTEQTQTLNIPGMSITMVYDQEIVYFKGYGYADWFNKTKGAPTQDTIFRIASCTKVFTDLLMFYLRDQGVISLDDPLTKYMPDFKIQDPYDTDHQITLRELASHTSGLQREIPVPWSRLGNVTQKEVLELLADKYLLFPQYSRGHYSNLGLSLLGRALQAAMKDRTYEKGVKDFILEPLQMRSSGFQVENPSQMGVGVLKESTGWVPAPLENLGWGNPMGGMYASSKDMANFLKFMFRTNTTRSAHQPFDGATVLEMQDPVVQTHDGKAAWGTPLEFNYTMNYWAKNKQGELSGFRTVIGMLPEIKFGIFIGILQSDVPDGGAYSSPALTTIAPGLEKLLWKKQASYVLHPQASEFLGNYIDYVEGNRISVSLKDSKLYGSLGSTLVEMVWENNFKDQNVFRVRGVGDDNSCRGYDDGFENEFLYFVQKNSKIVGAHFMGNTYQKN